MLGRRLDILEDGAAQPNKKKTKKQWDFQNKPAFGEPLLSVLLAKKLRQPSSRKVPERTL